MRLVIAKRLLSEYLVTHVAGAAKDLKVANLYRPFHVNRGQPVVRKKVAREWLKLARIGSSEYFEKRGNRTDVVAIPEHDFGWLVGMGNLAALFVYRQRFRGIQFPEPEKVLGRN